MANAGYNKHNYKRRFSDCNVRFVLALYNDAKQRTAKDHTGAERHPTTKHGGFNGTDNTNKEPVQ